MSFTRTILHSCYLTELKVNHVFACFLCGHARLLRRPIQQLYWSSEDQRLTMCDPFFVQDMSTGQRYGDHDSRLADNDVLTRGFSKLQLPLPNKHAPDDTAFLRPHVAHFIVCLKHLHDETVSRFLPTAFELVMDSRCFVKIMKGS